MSQGSAPSELPPLNPSSSQNYQAPNPTGVRNVLIELQRMKKSINGQIQAVQSDQDRQIQQTDSQINITIRELSPKMQILERHNAFNQQQLDDVCERLSQLETSVVPNIHQKYNEILAKYEQSIKIDTQSKFQPFFDEIQKEHQKSYQFADTISNNITSCNTNLTELSRNYENLEKQSSELNDFVQNNILTITPKLLLIEKKLKAMESSTENSLQSSENQGDYQRIARKLKLDLDELESNGIPVSIQSSMSDTLANITTITNEIDQKFTSSKLSISNIDSAIKLTDEQQKEVDTQTENLIKTSNEIEERMKNTELEINNKLVELENSINDIKKEIGDKLNTIQQNENGERSITYLNQDMQFIHENAQKLFTQLNEDWNGFYIDNNTAHSIADGKIQEITEAINAELGLVRNILTIEEQAKWCKNRIQIWEKENQEKEKLKISEEQLKEKLNEIELKIKNAEKRLEQLDHQQAPEDVVYADIPLAELGPVPPIEIQVNDLGPMKIPSELKLTYDDHDIEILFPELPVREAASAQMMEQPSVNPTEDEPEATAGKDEVIQPNTNEVSNSNAENQGNEVNDDKKDETEDKKVDNDDKKDDNDDKKDETEEKKDDNDDKKDENDDKKVENDEKKDENNEVKNENDEKKENADQKINDEVKNEANNGDADKSNDENNENPEGNSVKQEDKE